MKLSDVSVSLQIDHAPLEEYSVERGGSETEGACYVASVVGKVRISRGSTTLAPTTCRTHLDTEHYGF